MRILSMTATFGKLEHETLVLQPGLNILHAPNEWGKSTWCAFILAMLYGIDTREKTTKSAIAQKERYAPWSGSPMSGRMDILHEGRYITIERTTKKRIPMGEFRAYETETGLEIPELTAANCGQQLLGVERSVYERSGFLRFSDLPVTEDANLRSRLNALVTTGDESGTYEAMGQKLRELKNRCRYNRHGLLPEAYAQREELEGKLRSLDASHTLEAKLRTRLHELEQWLASLRNHKTALRYESSKADLQRVAEAEIACDHARAALESSHAACRGLPSPLFLVGKLRELTDLKQQLDAIELETQLLPAPEEVRCACFAGMTAQEAADQAEADCAAAKQPPKKPLLLPFFLLGGIFLGVGAALFALRQFLLGVCAAGMGAGLLIVGFLLKHNFSVALDGYNRQLQLLCRRYGSDDPMEWVALAQAYGATLAHYEKKAEAYRRVQEELAARRDALMQKIGSGNLQEELQRRQAQLAAWDTLADTQRDFLQAEQHVKALRAMAKTAQPPTEEDTLTYTEAETDRLISDGEEELRQLHKKLGQCTGERSNLGVQNALQQELARLNERIEELELTYAALEYAQDALRATMEQLQRRFAPAISQRAQDLFSQLTGGKYTRLRLAQDLSLYAAAQSEDVLRPQQWRSDGTIDQLYLALRLAVAAELMPTAPMVLDDALVRFDDQRLAAAINLLKQESEQRQILLFTCQEREQKIFDTYVSK